jgi:hypothetical protein
MRKDRYTPTAAVVRIAYELAVCETNYGDSGGVEFDRWLAKLEQAAFDRGIMHGAKHGAQSSLWTTH